MQLSCEPTLIAMQLSCEPTLIAMQLSCEPTLIAMQLSCEPTLRQILHFSYNVMLHSLIQSNANKKSSQI